VTNSPRVIRQEYSGGNMARKGYVAGMRAVLEPAILSNVTPACRVGAIMCATLIPGACVGKSWTSPCGSSKKNCCSARGAMPLAADAAPVHSDQETGTPRTSRSPTTKARLTGARPLRIDARAPRWLTTHDPPRTTRRAELALTSSRPSAAL